MKVALVDNIHTYGSTVKEQVARGLQAAGYKVMLLGQTGSYSDFYEPFRYTQTKFRLTGDYRQATYRGIELWPICRGSLGYATPGEIAAFEVQAPSNIAEFYGRAVELIDHLEALLARTRIDCIVVWGGMFLEGQILTKLAARRDIPCYATEFSFDKTRFFFDAAGVIANRHSFERYWNFLQGVRLSSDETAWVREWVEQNYHGKSGGQPNPGIPNNLRDDLFARDKPNALLLCQCHIDTVITMDSPHYRSTIDAYREVVSACREREVNLIVKLHPGDIDSIKSAVFDEFTPYDGVTVIGDRNNLNVYSLMDSCDVGITINSQSGLEMLAKYKNVLTLGRAFFGGKGFNLQLADRALLGPSIDLLLQKPALSDKERAQVDKFLFYFLRHYLIEESEFESKLPKILAQRNPFSTPYAIAPKASSNLLTVDDEPGTPDPNDDAPNLAGARNLAGTPNLADDSQSPQRLRIVIVHPSPRYGGSGFYLQELGHYLSKHGAEVMILSEGSCPIEDQGIPWRKLSFDGPFLKYDLRRELRQFDPQIILQVGVRTKPMRAALEILVMTGARLIVQAEDDEFVPFQKNYPGADLSLLQILDSEDISYSKIAQFLRRVNWDHTARVALDPSYDRWVEPIMRVICYRLADMHTAIWYPMARRLNSRFGKPTFVIPPFITIADFDPTPLTPLQRSQLLAANKLSDDTFVMFVAGTIYDYSKEYQVFLDALLLLAQNVDQPLALVVTGRGRGSMHRKAQSKLKGKVYFRSLGVPDDHEYFQMIKACDVVCTPGFPDDFNRYRLSSRLVKAMAFAKPIFTFRCGFGESLSHGYNAFLTDGEDPRQWAKVLQQCMKPSANAEVGQHARTFAEKHFDAEPIVQEFLARLHQLVATPKHWQPAEAHGKRPKFISNGLGSGATLQRKLRKLRRDPQRFFADMVQKRLGKQIAKQ